MKQEIKTRNQNKGNKGKQLKTLEESKTPISEKSFQELEVGDIFYVQSKREFMEAWYILREWDQNRYTTKEKAFSADIIEENSWNGCTNSFCDHQLSKDNYEYIDIDPTEYIYIGNRLDFPEYFL